MRCRYPINFWVISFKFWWSYGLWNFCHGDIVSTVSWRLFELWPWYLVYWFGMRCRLPDWLLGKLYKLLTELRSYLRGKNMLGTLCFTNTVSSQNCHNMFYEEIWNLIPQLFNCNKIPTLSTRPTICDEQLWIWENKGFLAVRQLYSLNPEFSETCDKLQTDAVHDHLRYLNELLPSNFHEVRSLIFSFFRRGSFYQSVMQSRNFDYLLYVLF